MTLTEKLASFIIDTNLEKMPTEVMDLTRRAMIDTLGVAIAGSVQPAGRAVTAVVDKFGCKPIASIIGSKVRTSCPLAALVNGTIAHILDYDDFKAGTQGHPSAVIMPVVLSLGEGLKASGKELIEAYVLGIEVWAKISSIMAEIHLKGWHPTGVLGTIGAATAAAKLLKLTREETTMALGIASSEAAGLVQNFGTMTKALHAGNAAKNGIMAALLAKNGFTAAKNVLEGDANFLLTFYGKDIGKSRIVENLGVPFALISPGLSVKKYPSCGSTHRALDGILHLIELRDIEPEEVGAIICSSVPVAQATLRYTDPSTVLEGKFSMQFAMAVALTDHSFGLEQATEKKVNDPIIKNLMKRVTLRVHPDWLVGRDTVDNRPDVVAVRLKNGEEYSCEVLTAKGASENPLTEEELLGKYRECAKLALEDREAERCLELVRKLENLEDVSSLFSTCED